MEGGAARKLPPKEIKSGVEGHYEDREFRSVGAGCVWDVFKFTGRESEKFSRDYVVKELRGYELIPYYHERDERMVRYAADRLRRERNYLKRMYGKRLPNLLLREKIMSIPPKYEGQKGEVISVQERLGGYIRLDQILRDAKLHFKDEKEREVQLASIKEQLGVFVEITKQLLTREDEDSDFSHAIPEITHFDNLVVEIKEGKAILRLVDTNFVLPIEHPNSKKNQFETRSTYWLIYFEHHFLGRSLEDMAQDPVYKDNPIFAGVMEYHPTLPLLETKSIPYELGILGESPEVFRRKEHALREEWNERLDGLFEKLALEPYAHMLTFRTGNPRQITIETPQGETIIYYDYYRVKDEMAGMMRRDVNNSRLGGGDIHLSMLEEFILREVSD